MTTIGHNNTSAHLWKSKRHYQLCLLSSTLKSSQTTWSNFQSQHELIDFHLHRPPNWRAFNSAKQRLQESKSISSSNWCRWSIKMWHSDRLLKQLYWIMASLWVWQPLHRMVAQYPLHVLRDLIWLGRWARILVLYQLFDSKEKRVSKKEHLLSASKFRKLSAIDNF